MRAALERVVDISMAIREQPVQKSRSIFSAVFHTWLDYCP